MNVHWTATSGLDGGEERERLSAAVPPGVAIAEDSAKLVWACKRLLNGNKRAVRSINLVKSIFIFIEFRGYPEELLSVTGQG